MAEMTIEQAKARLDKMAESSERSAERGNVFDQNPQLAAMAVAAADAAKAIRLVLERLKEAEGANERLARLGRAIESERDTLATDLLRITEERNEAEVALSASEARVRELEEALKEMDAAFCRWTGMTTRQEQAIETARALTDCATQVKGEE